MATKHDKVAKRLAKKKGVKYNQGKGPDIISDRCVIEVETANTVRDGLRQLQGYTKPAYIAGVDEQAKQAALEATKGKTVGVMDPQGNIVKCSTRKSR